VSSECYEGGLSGNRSEVLLGAIILAAGRSQRMGRSKLLLPWGGSSVLSHLVAQWQRVGARQIGIVHAAEDSLLCAELQRLHIVPENWIPNPEPARGMFSSIVCAARWTGWRGDLSHFAIVLGDQPHLRTETLHELVRLCSQNQDQVCQPSFHGRRVHPVIVPKNIFIELATTRVATLKEFLALLSIASFDSKDPGLELDLDDPNDYARALELRKLDGGSD